MIVRIEWEFGARGRARGGGTGRGDGGRSVVFGGDRVRRDGGVRDPRDRDARGRPNVRSVGGDDTRRYCVVVYGHPRNPMRAGRGGSGSPHVLVNARPAVQVSALRDHRVGGDVQADVTLERALPLALAPSLLSRGDLARGACGVRLARERAPVPRGQVSREGRVLRLHPIPPHGAKAHAERRRLSLGAARRALWRPRDRPRGVNPFCPTRAFSDEISVARSRRAAADASDAIESNKKDGWF
jgi:hypothetical protein